MIASSTGDVNPVTSRGDYDVNRRLLQRRIAETSNVLPPDSHRPMDRISPPSYNDVTPVEPPDINITRESRTPSRGATPNRTDRDAPPSYNDVMPTEVPRITPTRNISGALPTRHIRDTSGDTSPPTYSDVIPREPSVRPPPTYNDVTTREIPTAPENTSPTSGSASQNISPRRGGASENSSPTRGSSSNVPPSRPSAPRLATADAPDTTSGQVSDLVIGKPYKLTY